jgi:hypothetical protein
MSDTMTITSLLRPVVKKTGGRKVWGLDLETTLVPFFTAKAVEGQAYIPPEVLGCPVRLQRDEDGEVKFSKTGKPVIRVAQEMSGMVRLMRENLELNLQAHAIEVKTANPDKYAQAVKLNMTLGKPIAERDALDLTAAIDAKNAAAVAAATAAATAKVAAENPEQIGRAHV